ncbi:MAG: hypothetical protein ABIT76_03815 [Chthoniobacterales bacterium]
MTDPASPSDPAPEPKKRKARGVLSTRLLKQLTSDEEIFRATIDEMSGDASLTTKLAQHCIDRDNTVPITPASLAVVLKQVADARQDGANTTSKRAALNSITGGENTDAKTAIAAIRNVQSRAKGKYEEANPARLTAYYVGKPLKTRPQITQAGAAVFTLLRTKDDDGQPVEPQDTLPGFDQSKIDQLEADLGSYGGVQTRQSGARKAASDGRLTFEESCAQVGRRRRKLQLAIDAERPHTDPNNAPLRTRLGLPTDGTVA